ncbi:MAG: sensor histidine kinase [Candidatus Krumholzibacteriia bacterium]
MTGPRAPLLGAVLACAVLVVAVSAGLLGLQRAAGHRLEEALGQRLLAVATALAAAAEPDSVEALSLGSAGRGWAARQERSWQLLAVRAGLAEITLIDPEGRILATTAANLLVGETSDFWSLDEAAVDSVRATGIALALPTRLVGSVPQASAYAPLRKDDPLAGPFVQAVLTVRASPDFHDALAALRRGALATLAVVLAVMALVVAVLVRLAASVRRARAQLVRQESLAAMGRMTAGIAHEIRNPLGIIRGAGQHLQRVLADAGIDDEVAGFIPEEVDRLDRILSGYLAFGRDGDSAAEVFALGPVVRRGVALLEGELTAAGVGVTLDLPADDLTVRGDPRRLQQVLLNLLLNARDAMPGGGTVTVTLARGDGGAVLAVRDEGGGLDAAPEQCFEPFWTTKEKGGGLGLSLSRRIVAGMGGTLELGNRADRSGAEALVRLPVLAPADAATIDLGKE